MRPGPPRTPLLLFPPRLKTPARDWRRRRRLHAPARCSSYLTAAAWSVGRASGRSSPAAAPAGCAPRPRPRALPRLGRSPLGRPLLPSGCAAGTPRGSARPRSGRSLPRGPVPRPGIRLRDWDPPRGARAGPRAWDTATLTASQGLSAVPRPRAQSQALPQSVRSLRGLGEPDPRREWSHGEPRDRLDGGVKGEVGQRRARMEKLRLLHLDSWALRRPGIHPFRGSRGEGGGECALTASVSRRGALSMRLRTDSLSYVWHPCHTCAASHPPSHHSVDLLSQKFFPTNPVCVHRCVRGWGVVGEPHSPKTTPQCEWADLERRQIRCPL